MGGLQPCRDGMALPAQLLRAVTTGVSGGAATPQLLSLPCAPRAPHPHSALPLPSLPRPQGLCTSSSLWGNTLPGSLSQAAHKPSLRCHPFVVPSSPSHLKVQPLRPPRCAGLSIPLTCELQDHRPACHIQNTAHTRPPLRKQLFKE